MREGIVSDSRLPLIIAFFAIFGMAVTGHSTGRIYPWPLVIFFIALCVLLLITLRKKSETYIGVVSAAIILGVSYRLIILSIPTTTIGEATTRNARWMESVIEVGSTEAIPSAFYSDAPLHILQSSISAMILDIHSMDTFYLYAILFGVFLPLLAIVLLRSIGVENRRALAVAALLAIATTEGIRRSYWVFPQGQATIWFWLALAVLINHIQMSSKRWYGLIAFFIFSIAFTHKLPLLVFSATLIILLLLYETDKLVWKTPDHFNPRAQVVGLVTLASCFTTIQILYFDGQLNSIIARIHRFFGSDSAVGSTSGFSPTAAIEARPGIIAEIYEYPVQLALYFERGHIFWLLLFGGLAWTYIYLFMKESPNRESIQVLLAAAAACVALVPIGVVSIGAMNPTRPILLVEPIIIVLVVGMVWGHRDTVVPILQKANSKFDTRTVASGILIVLLASQVFAASAAPDYANTPRYYLDAPEAHSKTTLCEYGQSPIYTDQNYHRLEGIDRESCDISFERYSRENTGALYNANVSVDDHPTVAYRHDVDVYQGLNARWHLTWDPETELPKEYNVILSNEDVTVFHAPEE